MVKILVVSEIARLVEICTICTNELHNNYTGKISTSVAHRSRGAQTIRPRVRQSDRLPEDKTARSLAVQDHEDWDDSSWQVSWPEDDTGGEGALEVCTRRSSFHILTILAFYLCLRHHPGVSKTMFQSDFIIENTRFEHKSHEFYKDHGSIKLKEERFFYYFLSKY